VLVVADLENQCAAIASRFYGSPDKNMTLVAVTGTDGKTSVCQFIAQSFAALERPCGYIGTLGWGIGQALNKTALTTPDSVSLRRMLAVMREQGADVIALEASSHGIAEGRLDGLTLDVAVLTNLGRDHLDYHKTIEAYQAAKAKLFDWSTLNAVVVNADDALGRRLLVQSQLSCCYSFAASGQAAEEKGHHVLAKNIIPHESGLHFDLHHADQIQSVSTKLLGRFNVDNLLATYATLCACGAVVIDYSHTPNALQVAIECVQVHCAKALWVVFGCGGDRDAGKRAPMARAAQIADHIVLTDDNPRTEKSQDIINDVLSGFDTTDNVTVISDRAQAIKYALSSARAGDLVLIAGKGHEDYQIVGEQRLHFSDREQVLSALGLAS